jgi:hypothetical protein
MGTRRFADGGDPRRSGILAFRLPAEIPAAASAGALTAAEAYRCRRIDFFLFSIYAASHFKHDSHHEGYFA